MQLKLFTKYNRINIAVTFGIFLIASIAFYFTLNYVQVQQIDGDLLIEEEEIVLYVKKYKEIPKTFSVDDQIIQFTAVTKPFLDRYFLRKDLKDVKGELEDFRQLIFGIQAGEQCYKVTVSKSMKDTDNLIQSVLWITFCTIMLILLGSFLINRFVLKKLWKPFYRTLEILKEFKIDKEQEFHFPSTTTDEFARMIEILERSTQQARHDYLSLKTFSENASHEIQTPIAIIQSKLELLMQDERLTENQFHNVQTIAEALGRLKRLNSSLLLLTKIENRQFADKDVINIKEKTEQKMFDFKELWDIRQIELSSRLEDFSFDMNGELADILMNNLLSNATRHNYTGGKILIHLNRKELTIANTSEEPPLDKKRIFQRFYKTVRSREHNGLGLSIIKQICDTSGIAIEYSHTGNMHIYRLGFLGFHRISPDF